MKAEEKYVMGEHFYLVEEKCIQVIEKELESFFEIRLKFIILICELYIKGSIKNTNDILNLLYLSNNEIKTFIETVIYKVSGIINYNLSERTIYFDSYMTKII